MVNTPRFSDMILNGEIHSGEFFGVHTTPLHERPLDRIAPYSARWYSIGTSGEVCGSEADSHLRQRKILAVRQHERVRDIASLSGDSLIFLDTQQNMRRTPSVRDGYWPALKSASPL